MNCTKCNGLLVQDWLDEDGEKWVPALKCVNCGKYWYPMADKKELSRGNQHTLNEIGDILGCTRQNVTLIEKQAMAKLRNRIVYGRVE